MKFAVREIIGEPNAAGKVRVSIDNALFQWVATNDAVLKERGVDFVPQGVRAGYILRDITLGGVTFNYAFKGPRFTKDAKAEHLFFADVKDAKKHLMAPKDGEKNDATDWFDTVDKTVIRTNRS